MRAVTFQQLPLLQRDRAGRERRAQQLKAPRPNKPTKQGAQLTVLCRTHCFFFLLFRCANLPPRITNTTPCAFRHTFSRSGRPGQSGTGLGVPRDRSGPIAVLRFQIWFLFVLGPCNENLQRACVRPLVFAFASLCPAENRPLEPM